MHWDHDDVVYSMIIHMNYDVVYSIMIHMYQDHVHGSWSYTGFMALSRDHSHLQKSRSCSEIMITSRSWSCSGIMIMHSYHGHIKGSCIMYIGHE
jgi:hypothetical protein